MNKKVAPPEPRPQKNPGRPRAAAGDGASREHLLDAAAALFAARGLTATSLAKVAAEAGLTSAMVHYYFNSKERLIEAVVKERLGVVLAYVSGDGDFDPHQPIDYLAGVIHRLAEASEQFPWLPALWIREIVTAGGGLRKYMGALLPLGLFQRLGSAYADGQRDGRFPAEIEPQLLLFTAISNLLLPLVVRDLLENMVGMNDLTTGRLAAHAEAVVRHGLAGLSRAPGRKTPGGRERGRA